MGYIVNKYLNYGATCRTIYYVMMPGGGVYGWRQLYPLSPVIRHLRMDMKNV